MYQGDTQRHHVEQRTGAYIRPPQLRQPTPDNDQKQPQMSPSGAVYVELIPILESQHRNSFNTGIPVLKWLCWAGTKRSFQDWNSRLGPGRSHFQKAKKHKILVSLSPPECVPVWGYFAFLSQLSSCLEAASGTNNSAILSQSKGSPEATLGTKNSAILSRFACITCDATGTNNSAILSRFDW
jgi:hypothetical protein